jgi:hypothetical protein
MGQCRAKSKQTQQQCKQRAMRGKAVCHYHGGKTPAGYGLPQTKTGKYSSLLPLRLA